MTIIFSELKKMNHEFSNVLSTMLLDIFLHSDSVAQMFPRMYGATHPRNRHTNISIKFRHQSCLGEKVLMRESQDSRTFIKEIRAVFQIF